MSARRRSRLPPGRQLYDPLNGMRVGVFAGAAVGAVFLALLGAVGIWFLLGSAVLGGAAGYLWERRRLGPPD